MGRICLGSWAAFRTGFGATPIPGSVWRFGSSAGARSGAHWAGDAFEGEEVVACPHLAPGK